MSGFEIAEVALGAGWLGICPMPGKTGNYPGDLQALIAWAPDLVLTLAGDAELAAGGAAHLARDLSAEGIAWRHMPITDFGVPSESEGALWPMLAEEVQGWLERGGRVVVHCRGGCGRSGMIALRLMVEAGEAPEAALARLRVARPCAVETEEQQAWATEGL